MKPARRRLSDLTAHLVFDAKTADLISRAEAALRELSLCFTLSQSNNLTPRKRRRTHLSPEGAALAAANITSASVRNAAIERSFALIESLTNAKMCGSRSSVRNQLRSNRGIFETFSSTHSGKTDQDQSEILRYANALAAAEELGDDPITPESFVSIHASLLEGSNRTTYAGMLRTSGDQTGGSRFHTLGKPNSVPPAQEIDWLLKDLADFCNETDLPSCAQAAVAHAQLLHIHPFQRANGKIALGVIQLVLSRRKATDGYIAPLSLAFATRPHDYERAVSAAIDSLSTGTPEGLKAWIELFAQSCLVTSENVVRFVSEIDSLRQEWINTMNPRSDSAVHLIAAGLSGTPVFSAAEMSELTGRSFKRTSLAIDEMVKAGVLTQVSEGRRNRIFECSAVVDAYASLQGLQ